MNIKPTDSVIVVLHSPREKLLGILDEINPAGISLRSIDLSYFDDWCRSIAAGEPHLPMSENFFPMWRVERVSKDETVGDVQSMADQFTARTGRELAEF